MHTELGFLAVALGLFAAARFSSGHYRSGWFCIAASGLVLIDGYAFSLFLSVLAGGAMVAAGLDVVADTVLFGKRRGPGKGR